MSAKLPSAALLVALEQFIQGFHSQVLQKGRVGWSRTQISQLLACLVESQIR